MRVSFLPPDPSTRTSSSSSFAGLPACSLILPSFVSMMGMQSLCILSLETTVFDQRILRQLEGDELRGSKHVREMGEVSVRAREPERKKKRGDARSMLLLGRLG